MAFVTNVWPASLGNCFLRDGFQYGPLSAVLRTNMDAGVDKVRNRYTSAIWNLQGSIIVTVDQKETLDDFFALTLYNGSLPFLKIDPIHTTKTYSWRFLSPPSYTPFGWNTYVASIQLERLPATTVYSPAEEAFVTQWRIPADSQTLTLPLFNGGTYSFLVDWGDGTQDTITAYDQAETVHTYPIAGDFYVTITGTCTRWYQNNAGDKAKLIDIYNWGDVGFSSLQNAFYGCLNATCSARDVLDTSAITNIDRVFSDCSLFNGNVQGWDVSAVTTAQYAFNNCSVFNSDISSWDTASLADADYMFYNCEALTYAPIYFDITSMTSATAMLSGDNSIETDSYTDLLINWAAQSTPQSTVPFGAENLLFGAEAYDARDTLTTTYSWTITDAGMAYQILVDDSDAPLSV